MIFLGGFEHPAEPLSRSAARNRPHRQTATDYPHGSLVHEGWLVGSAGQHGQPLSRQRWTPAGGHSRHRHQRSRPAASRGQTELAGLPDRPSVRLQRGRQRSLSLGTYLFQLVDANGVLVNHGLHAPERDVPLQQSEAALNLDHAYIVENGPRPAQGSINVASMKANVALASTFGALSSQAVQLNTAQRPCWPRR